MSIISRRFDKKETGTVFRHAESGKILYRLNARLDLYDWEMLQAMISLVYNAGVTAGSEQLRYVRRWGFQELNNTEK
ncbi:hypothetical protein HWQ17_23040 (plasmid) [Enterobacter pasteurii]|uniref:hypothetical protein n=1 Tax=Enterobacter pasteurii TaxID=3029761 RepID=UPI00159EA13B|nr:hypothetical protein [Enterobacter pasteurii]QLA70489.1 hypothetical protein HWQ17_23040 [Enterobacter pasteurii]